MPLKVSEMWALVSLELVLGLEVWLAVSIFASQLSISANYLLVLLLWWSSNYKKVEELGLLDVRLVVKVFFQLEWLSVEIVLRLRIGKTV